MDWYGRAAWPVLARLEPESAHRLVLRLLELAQRWPGGLRVIERLAAVRDPCLAVEAFGLRFPNPVGLAAGLDKDARAPVALAALGFGHVEAGTVTPLPQRGNPRPRVFRLPEQRALINRLGFPSQGARRVRRRLVRLRRPLPGGAVLGGNIGKNARTPLEEAGGDYAAALGWLYDAVDYVVVNVGSPNTPGLRALQAPLPLGELLRPLLLLREQRALDTGRRVPLLVKVAPDLRPGDLVAVAAGAAAAGADGLVAINTTVSREDLPAGAPHRDEAGGLSGEPLRRQALAAVRLLARESTLPVVGVGGISHPDHALALLDAGAVLVQVYTGLVYAGPGLPARICRVLLARRS